MSVTLEPFGPEHSDRFLAWMREPAVARYWGDADEQLAFSLDLPERYRHALICVDARPVGYVRWAYCDSALLERVGVGDLPDGSVDIDLFLGAEADRGKGVGRRALSALADDLFAEGVPLLSLISHESNSRAHRCFEAAGWRRDRPYQDDEFGACVMFLKER